MDATKLRALARAGGICKSCGGVCQPRIECAILATCAGLPLCECEDCKTCQRVRRAVGALEDNEEEAWKQ
jgi:hypothetical protein